MATIRDVAEKAGVSLATVSHVVNNTRYVSDAVREKVIEAMEVVGYRPNALARSLRRGKTHTIGLILPDSSNPFFAEVGRVIEDEAYHQGYSVVLCNTEGSSEKESHYVKVLTEKQVDGIIFLAEGDRAEPLELLLDQKISVVLVDEEVPDYKATVDVVIIDNYGGGFTATEHLIKLGHRRIACITGPSPVTLSAERVTGYRDALAKNNLQYDPSLVLRGDFHQETGYAQTRALLSLSERPTAIFACNDLMAMGALRAAFEMGLRVPQDLSIVGFDDFDFASFTIPPLTTIAQPKDEMGRLAIHLLVDRMTNESHEFKHTCLSTKLIVRGSCGEAKEKGV
jgi:LacI family transcriptional regulator